MSTNLKTRWIGWLLAAVVLLAPAAGSSQPQAEWTPLVTEIESVRGTYDAQRADFEAAHAAFEAFLVEVDALKGERAEASTLADDEAVRDALRQAREMALALQGESQELNELSSRLAALEGELTAAVEASLAEAEARLRQAPAGERSALLAEIDALSQLRERYQRPLPPVPAVELDAILLGLDEENTPEELRATADELSDNERRLEEHLQEIETRIGSLETQIAVRERDRMFRRESALFEEGVSSGRSATPRRSGEPAEPAGAQEVNTGNNGGGGSTEQIEGNTDSEPTSGEQPAGQPTDEPPATGGVVEPGAGAPNEGGEFNSDDQTDGMTDPDINTGGGRGNETPTDVEAPPAEYVPEFPAPSVTGVARPEGDPTILWGTGDAQDREGSSARDRLERLRRERDEARTTLEELRERREQLLERVQVLEAEEGF